MIISPHLECAAEANSGPLLPITYGSFPISQDYIILVSCFLIGDLGTSPKEVEGKVQEAFQLAKLWNCVLLIDKADLFLAQRSEDDIQLQRNAIVSAKLTKSGLIGLNHKVILDYAESFFESQQKPGSAIGLVRNGRKIRNAFQSVVALAGYKDLGAHKIELTCVHFERVSNISHQFNNYLWSFQSQSQYLIMAISDLEHGLMQTQNAVHGRFQQGRGLFEQQHGFTRSQQPQPGQQQQSSYQQRQQPTSSSQVQQQFQQSQPQAQKVNYQGQEQYLDVPSHGQLPRTNPSF
ncbi:hypothetical protein SCUP515_02432 [Seiridium cupressi]